jgi:hypothetical protein
MGEKMSVYRLFVGKPEGKRQLGRPRCKWVDNIRMDLERWDEVMWPGLVWLRIGTETSGSIKCWETIEWPNNCWPLE